MDMLDFCKNELLVVYKFSGVYENTVVDENSVVCKCSVKLVDETSVVAHFSGVDYFTLWT